MKPLAFGFSRVSAYLSERSGIIATVLEGQWRGAIDQGFLDLSMLGDIEAAVSTGGLQHDFPFCRASALCAGWQNILYALEIPLLESEAQSQ